MRCDPGLIGGLLEDHREEIGEKPQVVAARALAELGSDIRYKIAQLPSFHRQGGPSPTPGVSFDCIVDFSWHRRPRLGNPVHKSTVQFCAASPKENKLRFQSVVSAGRRCKARCREDETQLAAGEVPTRCVCRNLASG